MQPLLQFAVVLFVVWPVLTLWHELGHALLPLAAGRAPVAIRLGAGKAAFTVQLGPLRLGIAVVPLDVGWCDWTPPGKRATAIAICLLGPCASGLAA